MCAKLRSVPRNPNEPWTPAFGALFDSTLDATPDLNQNQAAARAGIRGTRWRQIVSGTESKGGQKIAVAGPSGTVAMMARGLGITPDQLRSVDHPLAAFALERLLEADAERDPRERLTQRERLLAIREHVDALLLQIGDK